MEDPDYNRTQEANIWHNLIYSFENPFSTPFDTPRGENNVSLTMHLKEIKFHLEEQERENERLKDVIHTREKSYHQAELDAHAHNDKNRRGYYKNPFDNILLGGIDGNNTPPRTPRVNVGQLPSPPRHSQSHHESDDEITSKDVMRF